MADNDFMTGFLKDHSTLGTLYGVGSTLSPWAPVAGLGMSLVGGLLDDSKKKQLEMERQQIELQRQQQAEQQREFGLNFGQHQLENTQQYDLQGFGQLAALRNEALTAGKQYRFNNAVYNALSGRA